MAADEGADQGGSGFAVVLRRHRLRAGLTQEELAVRAAIGVRTVRDLERGRASRPQRTTVELLSAALGLAAADREAFLAAARGQAPDEALPPTAFLRMPPPPAFELVGRDEDLDELAGRLSATDGPRGVTLVGIAGVGKTSLGFVVAHRVAGFYPGGVAGIVVTDNASAGELAASVAAGFGVGRPEDLTPRFGGRPALVFVDAVERAPEAAAEMLAQLLGRIPTLRFLATGRHPVGLPSERVWPLAPLLTPPTESETTLAEISAYPAVGLFLERLSRVRRTPLEPEEIAPLATLVRRLGGLPLAIELAAARSRVLTVPEILDRYGDRVLDLSRPGGAGPETVVSLRDAVAASYRLLNAGEQHALRRLSMFRYRWSLALAEQITAGTQTDGSDVVHLLDRLLELGLLSVRGSRTFRFRLLDVVRDYGAERAAAEGELLDGRRRHAELLAELTQDIAPDLVGNRLFDAASRLDDVAGDLGAALAFAAREEPEVALRIAASLPRWWRFRGRDVSGRQWLRRLLDDPRTADADPAVRAWAKVGLAQLALEHGAGAEEIESVESAVAEFEHLGLAAGQSTAHTMLAALWMTTGGYSASRRHGEAALALAQRSGKVRDMAVAENNLIWHEIREGDLAAARRRLAAVDQLASDGGDDRLRAVALANLAEVARLQGRPDEAQRLGRRAMIELERIGDPNHRRRLLATIGLALAEAGHSSEAEEVLTRLRVSDDITPDGPAAVVEAAIALRRGDQKLAAEFFGRAADAYEGAHDPRDVVEALVGLIVSTPDAEERAAGIRRLAELLRSNGITLVARELDRLGPEVVAQL
ncbi:tetratricopeptide repeat protein [Actinoplanes sp. NPDC051411]|uniref:ATP-binding protein n=1 Tax=Actinoplanes sp. NPDC051411 TaxID=3155522 RepID=UPI00343E9C7D